MKTILITILMLTSVASALAGQRSKTQGGVQTYDVPALLKEEASLLGKVVAVRFNYRSEKLRHLQPSWYEAALWQRDPTVKSGFSAVRVMVAKGDVPAFQSITSDFQSSAALTAYGRIEKDPDDNSVHLRFLGR